MAVTGLCFGGACAPKAEPSNVDMELPSLSEPPIIDCEIDPYELTLDEWVDGFDGFIVGVIEDVRPAGDPVAVAYDYSHYGLENEADMACEKVTRALEVHLRDVEAAGIEGAADVQVIYIGHDYLGSWRHPPQVDADRVIWKEGEGQLATGMTIAAGVHKEYGTERWGVNMKTLLPIFRVENSLLHVSPGTEYYFTEDICGGVPPIEQLDGANTSAILDAFRQRAKTQDYQHTREEARAIQDSGDDSGSLRYHGIWYSFCRTSQRPYGDECTTDDPCPNNYRCVDGFCIDF